ncbi:MAG: enolase C-terminal domain-like protein [Bacteroidota bacterium]|nr:enolase C-terminal domain-like protein [Bacteroidota bacterium]
MEWSIKKIQLELKYTWKISRNESSFKENFIVEACEGKFIGIGEVAPNIRYNETPENVLENFYKFLNSESLAVKSLDDLTNLLGKIKLPNALRFGIESAYIHMLCKKENKSIFELLETPNPSIVASCYTLPIMDIAEIETFFNSHQLGRFGHIKIKVSEEGAIEHLNALNKICSVPIMIDANEAWKDVDLLINFLQRLKHLHIAFIEQPLPASMKEEYLYLKKHCPFPLMADESVLDQPDFDLLQQQFNGINMKLMKAGGYLNGLRILNEARKRKMETMVGCMVETTLGISSAWNLCANTNYADLDGCLIVANEPYNLLKEENGYFTKTT